MIQGTFADLITIVRFILTPIIVTLLCVQSPTSMAFAIIFFLLACFTDYLDGRVARFWGVTQLGAVLDHTADKFFIVLILLTMCMLGMLKAFDWVPAIIMIARDILLSGVRELTAKFGLILKSDYWGKVKTVSQMFGVLLVFSAFFNPIFYPCGALFLWLAAFLSILSCYNYLKQFAFLLADKR